jgi:hypothetical protein
MDILPSPLDQLRALRANQGNFGQTLCVRTALLASTPSQMQRIAPSVVGVSTLLLDGLHVQSVHLDIILQQHLQLVQFARLEMCQLLAKQHAQHVLGERCSLQHKICALTARRVYFQILGNHLAHSVQLEHTPARTVHLHVLFA